MTKYLVIVAGQERWVRIEEAGRLLNRGPAQIGGMARDPRNGERVERAITTQEREQMMNMSSEIASKRNLEENSGMDPYALDFPD